MPDQRTVELLAELLRKLWDSDAATFLDAARNALADSDSGLLIVPADTARTGSLCEVCGRLDEAVGIIGPHKDRRHDRAGYSSLEHWCENRDGKQWRTVIVAPDPRTEATDE